VADQDLDLAITSELELIELAELETLIGVERKVILNKLSHAEIAEDLFAFRKSGVLNYIETKGVSYFAKRARRPLSELESLSDLEFVDERTLFDAVSAFDTYDLAKLLAATPDPAAGERLLTVMSEARRKEISWIMRRDIKIDALEVQDLEQRFVETVKSIKSTASNSPALAGPQN
jgi:hypothetical protein